MRETNRTPKNITSETVRSHIQKNGLFIVQDVGATKLVDVAQDASPHFFDVRVILCSVFRDQHALAYLQELPHLPHRAG